MTRGTGAANTAPLSVAQEALWYLSLLVPNQISYNEAISIRKDGPLDLDVFRRAFNEIVRRHEAWRSTFDVADGEPVQVVHEPPELELPVLDLSRLSPEEAERHAVRTVTAVSEVPYDLRRGPLVRPRLIRFPEESHRLYLAMHHLVFDGVSVYRVVLPELVALYNSFAAGEESPLPEPTAHYGDYARWEQGWILSSRAARRLRFWRERLTPAPPLALPIDHVLRPPTQRFRGGVIPLEVPEPTVARLRAVGRGEGATLFQVLATAWAVLLGRHAGQDDVVFSTAADLRQRPEFEALVGYSLTPLVLRVDLGSCRSFDQLVVAVRNELLDGLDNLVPFERIVRELAQETRSNANPIYQTMIILEPPVVSPDPAWSVHQMESEIGGAVGSAKLDLELGLDERPEGHITGRLIYDLDLFERSTAAELVDQWLRILEAVSKEPSLDVRSLPGLGPTGDRALAEWNSTTTWRPPRLVHELVDERAKTQPDAVAIVANGRGLTYAELCRQADETALRLGAAGVGPGDVVAFCAEPAVELVAGLLGALKAGAGYLLLDPTLPHDQLEFMVSEAEAALVYADPELASKLSGESTPIHPSEKPDSTLGGEASDDTASSPRDSLCCLQYSTGAGEGRAVPMHHGSVANLVRAMANELGLCGTDTVVVLRPTFFAASVLEVWLSLIAGAKMVLVDGAAAENGAALSRVMSDERASFLHASPETWQRLIDTGLRASRGLAALCGGGQLGPALAEEILDRCRVLFNAHGCPETTLYSTVGRVERSQPITIGRPIANCRASVIDSCGGAVPVGVVGLLLIAGEGVAKGFLAGSELVAGAFVEHESVGGLAYVTGDRARWRDGGVLELVPTHPAVSDRS